MAARMHHWIGLTLLAISTVGCVSEEQYRATVLDRDQYAARLAESERAKGEAVSARDAYKSQLDALLNNGNSKDALVTNQSNQINELQRQLDEINRRYEEAMSRVGKEVALPPELSNALADFARQNSDLVDFDATRGVVKFKSDLTFATGSAQLTPAATSAIERFATILNSPAAMAYELMVVGHTDNTPVQHEATIRAGHKDNWYLSAHRAISVGEELMHTGVTGSRMEVAGFADQRPIASNATSAGKAQNRRVEVLILPTTVRPSSMASDSPSPRRSHRTAPKQEFNKDATADTPQKPVFNK